MSEKAVQSFALLLKKYRLEAGLTQEELAERANLSVRGISDLERGARRTPYKETIELLAQALNLGPEQRQLLKIAAGRKPANSQPDAAGPLIATANQSPLIGREAELAQLFQHLSGKEPPVTMLVGEPGIGKTRLLEEAATNAVAQGWTVLTGSCTRRGGQSPYAPLLEALSGRLNTHHAGTLQADLRDCEWLVRLLPELSRHITPPNLKWHLSQEQERRLVFAAVSRYLVNIAGSAGTLLILDDLQWAGGDALDLLSALIHSSRPAPVCILGAYRNTEVRPGDPLSIMVADLARAGLVSQIELKPLDRQAAAGLVNNLLKDTPGRPLAANISRVLERTGGVPFYLISYIRGLQTGQADLEPGATNLPWDVKQTIRQRIAGLPKAAQELLEIAAVIGRVVPGELLLAATKSERPDREVVDAIELACQTRILIEDEHSDDLNYRFAHDLFREVVESDLSALRFRLLHSQVAAALELKFGLNRPEVLAYHYRQAGEWKKVLHYLLQAVEQAHQQVAHRDEANLLAQAIECALRTGQQQLALELRLRRGKVCRFLALWAEADKELTAALAGLTAHNPDRQAELLVTLAEVRHWQLDTPATRRYAGQALGQAEQSGRHDLLARARAALALAESSEGNIQTGLELFNSVFSRASFDQAELVSGVELQGLIYYWIGRADRSIASNQKALDLARQTYDITTIARALANLGLALSAQGRYAEAFRVFGEARQFAQEQAMGQWLARSISMCGGMYLEIYNYEMAERLAHEARQLSRNLNWPLADTSSGIDLLFNYIRTQRLEQARSLVGEVEKAVVAGQGAHGWLWRLRFEAALAELALARCEMAEAVDRARPVIELSQRNGRIKYRALGLATRGKALAALNRRQEAMTDLEQAVTLARSTGDPAMTLRAILNYLKIFPELALLEEAFSLTTRITASLDEQPVINSFLNSPELEAIRSAR